MGGPIPWTAIWQYAEKLNVRDEEDFDRFVYLIRQMDDEWTKYKEETKGS